MKLGAYAVEQDYSHYVQTASEIVLGIVSTATKGPINQPTVCSSPADFTAKFGTLNPNCLGTYAAYYFLSQGSKIWFVRAATSDATASVVSIAGADDSASISDALVMKAPSAGTDYDGYKVVVENVSTKDDTFDMIIKNKSDVTVETKRGLSLSSINEDFLSSYLVFESKSATATKITEGVYVLSGGNDGMGGITSAEYISAIKSMTPDTIDMNLVAIPGVADIAVVNAMISLVETRKDCLYLVDSPNNLTPSDVADWHNGSGSYSHVRFNSSYASLYYAWQKIYDSHNKIYVEVPPSVVVAPVIAYSTNVSEIWYAPAGLQRGLVRGVVSPVVSPDSGAMNTLYSGDNSVNCIYNDPQVGLCVFGQKTLSREDSALNRVNVRLLLNYLKRVVVAACRHMTFEPNDRVTWNNFEDLVEPTLKSIQNLRGIYEYKIVKGESIVTAEDIDNYRMPCKVLIRPTKSAEEIPIYFTITSTGAEFNDVLENDGINILD